MAPILYQAPGKNLPSSRIIHYGRKLGYGAGCPGISAGCPGVCIRQVAQVVLTICLQPRQQMTQASSPSAVGHSSVKQRHLSHLNSQLAQLHANLSDFTDLINTTCVQYKLIQRLGIMHGSLFMASHTVFEHDNYRAE